MAEPQCPCRIVFVPGKNPKPVETVHRELLWRSLVHGVSAASPRAGAWLDAHPQCFSLAAWNPLFYKHSRAPGTVVPWVDRLLARTGPSPADRRAARSLRVRMAAWLYLLVDFLPGAIDVLPLPEVRAAMRETRRYFANTGGVADRVRGLLAGVLRRSFAHGERVLLIAHSMGSVIAWDTLWQLARGEESSGRIDCLLTLGSPLGLRYVQRRLAGHDRAGAERYPDNVDHWINVAAEGDLVAADCMIGDDFAAMRALGLVQSIEDHHRGIFNYFRTDRGLNVHRSYGYLANAATGALIARWLAPCDTAAARSGLPAAPG